MDNAVPSDMVITAAIPQLTIPSAFENSKIMMAPLQGRGRATGFPKLVVQSGVAWLVWTDVIDGVAQLKGARVTR